MDVAVRLYLTTRDDPVSDLDDVKTAEGLASWKRRIQKHAVKAREYSGLSQDIVADLAGYNVLECYAVISYPLGEMVSANGVVGKELMGFLKANSEKIEWRLEKTGKSAVKQSKIAKTHAYLDVSNMWDNFTYGLIADKSLSAGKYGIDLEAVVAKG